LSALYPAGVGVRLEALYVFFALLTLASNDKTLRQGIALLFAYSAGLALPFLLSSVALGGFLEFFKKYRPFIPTVERVAGVLLVVVGILVVTSCRRRGSLMPDKH
jgi:cytochrome c-type biogenesis protein